jgi:hypothetical protein
LFTWAKGGFLYLRNFWLAKLLFGKLAAASLLANAR